MASKTWSLNPSDWAQSRGSRPWNGGNSNWLDAGNWLDTDDRNASLVLGGVGLFAVGAAVGVGLGLLLAPKSGRDLRYQLGLERMRSRLPGGNREPDLDMSPEYGTQTTPPGTR